LPLPPLRVRREDIGLLARHFLYQALKPGYGHPAKSSRASKQRAQGNP
jgi:DNA-binding NtrC family response regulator